METFAEKNRFETELRCTPSDSGVGKGTTTRQRKKALKWIVITALCIVAGWFVFGIAKEVVSASDATLDNLLTVLLILRWLFFRRVSALNTAILIILTLTPF